MYKAPERACDLGRIMKNFPATAEQRLYNFLRQEAVKEAKTKRKRGEPKITTRCRAAALFGRMKKDPRYVQILEEESRIRYI